MRAARAKKDVLFQIHRIVFFLDLSAEVNKQCRQFDEVKKSCKLRDWCTDSSFQCASE